jgi:hypothetical protein
MWHVCEISEVLTDFQLGSMREADYVEEVGVHGRIILKWIFKKIGGVDPDSSGSGYGQKAGCGEHGNERSFSIKFGKFLD